MTLDDYIQYACHRLSGYNSSIPCVPCIYNINHHYCFIHVVQIQLQVKESILTCFCMHVLLCASLRIRMLQCRSPTSSQLLLHTWTISLSFSKADDVHLKTLTIYFFTRSKEHLKSPSIKFQLSSYQRLTATKLCCSKVSTINKDIVLAPTEFQVALLDNYPLHGHCNFNAISMIIIIFNF